MHQPSSRRYYPDGSCLRPRLPEVRVAAWAVVGCINGVWWCRAGPCPGLQTTGRAELAAIVQILNGAEPDTIITDCEGVQRRCVRIQDSSISREELGRCTNADLWNLGSIVGAAPVSAWLDRRVAAQPPIAAGGFGGRH